MIKILLIEDSEVNTLLVRSLFDETSTYEVISAGTGRKALKYLDNEIPDIILMDLMLPDIDGFELLSQIRKDYNTTEIPIVVVSAKNEREDIQRAKSMGATDYILKPIGINNLFSRVINLLHESSW